MSAPRPNVRLNIRLSAPASEFEGQCLARARYHAGQVKNQTLDPFHFYLGFFFGAGLSESRAESLASYALEYPKEAGTVIASESQFTKMPNGELVREASSMMFRPGEWPESFVLQRTQENGGRRIRMTKSAARHHKVGGFHEFAGYAYISQLEDSKPHSVVAFILND